MTKILAIDTSSFVMGIAVTEDGRTLGEVITNIKKNHSLRLMPAIDDLMKEVNVRPKELDRIVVANGPGSYTGVRIGVTTAKTLAWSLSIPVVGVSSLAVMAQAGRFFNGVITPIMDARRGQVYTGLYKADGGKVESVVNDQLLQLTDWLDLLVERQEPVLFVGQDCELHREAITERLGTQVTFAPGTLMLPRPSELANLGATMLTESDTHLFVPEYLQLAEAEAKWKEAQKEKSENDD